MEVQQNKEETQGTYSKENATKLIFTSNPKNDNWIIEYLRTSGRLSKEYIAELSIINKARAVLTRNPNETVREIRVVVEKPSPFYIPHEHARPQSTCVNNCFIVHFKKYRKTNGRVTWKFQSIDY